MVRPGTIAAIAMAVAALAVIALAMGIVAAMPSGSPAVKSCGHVLDRAYRGGAAPAGCAKEVDQRRLEIGSAAAVAGVAAIVGVAAVSRAARDGG